MHDGSIGNLDEVLDHYARGGRLISEGVHQGDGRDNPYKDPLLEGFELSEYERLDLLALFKNAHRPSIYE
jgi:cytochrome c peroxidase